MVPQPNPSFAQHWARKYVNELLGDKPIASEGFNRDSAATLSVKSQVANRLLQALRPITLQAWTKTESLLATEIQRHQIDRKLVNPWKITEDIYQIYEKTLEFYSQSGTSQRLPIALAPAVGRIRQKYTAQDPRVIGFVSLQFHYTGVLLLQQLNPLEKPLLEPCFKIIDDHLYMPLHRAYASAAQHPYDSPLVAAVQQLVPHCSVIAKHVVQRVSELYPGYSTFTGPLSHPTVQKSSIRDVEMFQIYLWVCILEQSLAPIQQELFPLCVMIYPAVRVHWELVRQMLHMLGQEFQQYLGTNEVKIFLPYLNVLRDMFSPEVFPSTLQ
jgi:hypothetical protein